MHLPKRLGLGNLHDSLYVEYWGWEYGLPEKSPPLRKQQQKSHSDRDEAHEPLFLYRVINILNHKGHQRKLRFQNRTIFTRYYHSNENYKSFNFSHSV